MISQGSWPSSLEPVTGSQRDNWSRNAHQWIPM